MWLVHSLLLSFSPDATSSRKASIDYILIAYLTIPGITLCDSLRACTVPAVCLSVPLVPNSYEAGDWINLSDQPIPTLVPTG